MQWKPVVSVILSVISICVHTVGLSYASSGAVTVANGGPASQSVAAIADIVDMLAIVLALAALTLAVISWPKEPRWVRATTLVVALAALLWSFVAIYSFVVV